MFFAVPKTGSKSLKAILREHYGAIPYGNYHNVVIPTEYCHYYTICSVRHPYTRACSLYYYIISHREHRCHAFVKENGFHDWLRWLVGDIQGPTYYFVKNDVQDKNMTEEMELEFFRQSIDLCEGKDLNQTDYLSYAFGANYLQRIHYIIRLETIREDFNNLPFVNGCQEIPVINVSRDKSDWRDLVDREAEELIYRWAEHDFRNFNYAR